MEAACKILQKVDKPEAILFDLDNTLYLYEPCHLAGLDSVAKFCYSLGIVNDIPSFLALYETAKERVKENTGGTAASHNRALYFQYLVQSLIKKCEAGLVLQMYDHYWNSFLEAMALEVGVLDFIKEARARSVKLAVVSDLTAHIQLRKLVRLGLEGVFDLMVTSEEAAAEKPDPKMMEIALSRLGVSSKNVWMIGDSIERDVAASKKFGLLPILFERSEIESDSLEELPGYIKVGSFHKLKELLAV